VSGFDCIKQAIFPVKLKKNDMVRSLLIFTGFSLMRGLKNFFKIGLSLAGWFALCQCALIAQTGGKPSVPRASAPPVNTDSSGVRGRVVLPDGSFVDQSVRVTLQNDRGNETTIFTDAQGQFEFRGIAPGNYQLIVEGDKQRFETVATGVQIFRGMSSFLTVHLKPNDRSKQPTMEEKTISVEELSEDIPSAARKEFEKANAESAKGNANEAISHLKKAIEIHPNFAMAYNNLGVQFLGQGKLDEAADALNRALAINPNAFNPRLNLGIVLVKQHRFAEAADVLKRAIALRSDAPAARLYAGIALLGSEESEAAEKELKTAYELGGHKYALALFHLGQLYMNIGERGKALASFEAFLKEEPNSPNAAQVRKLIGLLQ
jgi:tetratricopeptide (TPR) repeat protein